MLDNFATLTLGSGGAAMVLGRASTHPEGHRFVGGVEPRRDAAQPAVHRRPRPHDHRRARALLEAGVELALDTWTDASAEPSTGPTSTPTSSTRCPRSTPPPSRRPSRIDPARTPVIFPTRGQHRPGVGAVHARAERGRLRGRPADRLHGHRLGTQRRGHRNRVVTRDGSDAATFPPAGLPGLDPAWSRLVTARDSDGVPRTWHVLDTHAQRPAPTVDAHPAVRSRQPDVVVPVASPAGRGARRRAGGGGRPARHGLLRAHAHRATARAARRRPRHGRATRSTSPARRHGRPRLGRPDLPRMGAAPSRPAGGRRPAEHRGAPAGRLAGPVRSSDWRARRRCCARTRSAPPPSCVAPRA